MSRVDGGARVAFRRLTLEALSPKGCPSTPPALPSKDQGDGTPELVALGDDQARVYDSSSGDTLVQLSAHLGDSAPFVECLGDVGGRGLPGLRLQNKVWIDPLGAPAVALEAADETWDGAVTWTAGDLTGDGQADLLVPSASGLSLTGGPVTSLDSGMALVSDTACWGQSRVILGGVDFNADGIDDVALGRNKSRVAHDCSWEGPGRIDIHLGPITGPLDDANADYSLDGDTIKESCHLERTGDNKVQRCGDKVEDHTGDQVGSGYPSFGVLPDLDGDGLPELWVITTTDWQERTVWVVRGGG